MCRAVDMASPSPVHESELVSFFIYNPELGAKEGTVRKGVAEREGRLENGCFVG